MRLSRYWAALVLATCAGAAAQVQLSGAEPEIGPVRDTAAASPSYRLESVRIGSPLEGTASSPSYRLEFLPAYGAPPQDTTPGDITPPLVVITRPGMDTAVNTPAFTVEYSVDGVAGFQEAFTLVEGMSVLVVDSTDAAGNRGADTVRVTLDTQPPVVAFTSPLDGTLTNESLINIAWTVDGVSQTEKLIAVLQEGPNSVVRTATDNAGNVGSASITVTRDSQRPVVAIISPAPDTLVATASITVAYTVDGIPFTKVFPLLTGSNVLRIDTTDAAGNTGGDQVTILLDDQGPYVEVTPNHQEMLANQPVRVKIAFADSGAEVNTGSLRVFLDSLDITPGFTIERDSATATLDFDQGSHTISVSVQDALGNSSARTWQFTGIVPAPPLNITSPANLTTVRTADILVEGQFHGVVTDLRVDGIPAMVSGAKFHALVPLIDGKNTVSVTAFDSVGSQISASVTITLDREKPRIYIHSPSEGLVIVDSVVTVTGSVSDRIADAQNQSMPAVAVNGVVALVVNNTFSATVPLAPGANTLTAVATDRAGNLESAVAQVTLNQSSVPSIAGLSGGNQSAPVFTLLPQPLRAMVRDASGQPVSGRPVIFNVTKGDGGFSNGARSTSVNTDAEGIAEVSFKLGKRAGPGANEVRAKSEGYIGAGIFQPMAVEMPASRILTAGGDLQRGIAGSLAPHPLTALVTDSASNPIQGVSVKFRVIKGSGSFNGWDVDSGLTGADGKVSVPFTLGMSEGRDNNLVEATFEGNPSQSAMFVLSGYLPGPASETRVSGIVLDNSNRPLENVTVRIEENGQQVTTDSHGRFEVANAPVGNLHLHVDGTTASSPGDWVTLMFEVNAISGKNNDVGMPIYLVARNNSEGKIASPSQSQVLTLEQIPGFELDIPAGSATFPADVDDHLVTVTAVHTDKIPMPPGEGMQPRFIISIGPPQVKFDPPAPITYPNVDGLKPGEQTHFYSFDHDLGTFVSIGTGTVSEDGSTITSDKGFGIVKGGWHCAGPGNPTGRAKPPTVEVTEKELVLASCDGGPGCPAMSVIAKGEPLPGAEGQSYEWLWQTGIPPTFADLTTSNYGNSQSLARIVATGNGYGETNLMVRYTCKSGNHSEWKQIKVTVVKTTLQSLRFTSDHGVLLDNNTDLEPNGAPYTEPEWIATGTNNPISHTMNQNLSAEMRIRIDPPSVSQKSFTITGEGGVSGFNFNSIVALRGGDNIVTLSSKSKIQPKIQKIVREIEWKILKGSETVLEATTGPHTAYITMGAPRQIGVARFMPTQMRMERAVSAAGSANSIEPLEIIKKVIQDQGEFDLNMSFPPGAAWNVPELGGDCQSIVRYTEKVANMVNVPGELTQQRIYAIETAPKKAILVPFNHGGLNVDRRTGPNGWELALIDGGGGCNAYEAVAAVTYNGTTTYFGGGTTAVTTDPDEMLSVFRSMSWVELIGGTICMERQVLHRY